VLHQHYQQQDNSGDGYESSLGAHQQDSTPFQ